MALLFLLSSQINRGGRKKKSTNSAIQIVIAVIRPISAFSEKLDCAKIIKPAVRIMVVINRASPTVLKA